MKLDSSYCLTHDVYGKAVYAEVGDEQIINYFIHNNQLITSTYDRRTTVTSESIMSLPSSMA